MTRKLSAMFLLSFLFVVFIMSSMAFGLDKPYVKMQDRAVIPARFAPMYAIPTDDAAALAPAIKDSDKLALGARLSPPSDTIGFTTYGYQQNCTMGRQVEHRGQDYVHFDWMWQETDDIGDATRSIYYQAFDLGSCQFLMTSGGIAASTERAGYVSLDAHPGGFRGIPAGHEYVSNDLFPMAYYDFDAGTGAPFGLFTKGFPADNFGYYANAGTGPLNENAWPKIEWQVGSESVLHMVTSESGGAAGDPSTISYYRRVGGYDDVGVWSDQHVIDTTMNINQTVASLAGGDRVAIVWNAPVDYHRDLSSEFDNQVENDVWYAISETQGSEWASTPTSGGNPSIGYGVDHGTFTGANITTYSPMSDYKAYCDISALITTDGNLHIVWSGYRWTDTTSIYRRQAGMFHWSENHPEIRTVAIAHWDTNGACYAHAWSADIAKMSISECANGNLYILYTQFGKPDNPCGDVDDVNQVLNGYLYMTASDDQGYNWDRGRRVTNTPETPNGCTAADMTDTTIINDCNSEHWASMARFSRVEQCGDLAGLNVLDILYIDDLAPGGCVQTESGVWTMNPVIWWSDTCRAVVYEPLYFDDAGTGYGECYSTVPLVVEPDGTTLDTLNMTNPGLLVNNWDITLDPPSTDWVVASPTSGALSAGGGTQAVELTYTAPAGAADPSTYTCTIQVNHEVDGGTVREIPTCLVVASKFVYPNAADLSTACKRVKIYNNGRFVNNTSESAFDYFDDCDTASPQTSSGIYLYDGGPIMCRIDGTDTLRYMNYSTDYTANTAMRPLDSIFVDSTTYGDYTYARVRFADADTLIGYTVEYYVPKHADTCEFIVQVMKFYSAKGDAVSGVLVGEFFDWDVPSDSGSENGSDFDISRDLIYQYGAEYDTTGAGICPQLESDRYAGVAIPTGVKNAMTLDNATWVYTSSRFGNANPLAPGPTYDVMNDEEGFSKWSSTSPDSVYEDLSMLLTFGVYDFTAVDTFEVAKILATSKTGLLALQDAIDAGVAWGEARELWSTSCCVVPGDANSDLATNVGDAVYLINYAFKGGPAPLCLDAGDANVDCAVNVGDAVYLINYAFKGGPAPNCGCVGAK